jgi:hypothetical protein
MLSMTLRSKACRNARVFGSIALLCVGSSGYSSGCGGVGTPNPPEVVVEASSVEWAIGQGEPEILSRRIGVTQAPGLSASVQYQGEPPADWLTAEIGQDADSFVVLLTASGESLPAGSYGADVLVEADEYVSARIEVILAVTP